MCPSLVTEANRVATLGDHAMSVTLSLTESVAKVWERGARLVALSPDSASVFHSFTDQSALAVSMAECEKGESLRRLMGPACAATTSRYCSR